MGGIYLRDLKFQTGSSPQASSQSCKNCLPPTVSQFVVPIVKLGPNNIRTHETIRVRSEIMPWVPSTTALQ